ncbi:DMT family transporter [Palleronia sp. THAF1]|uniref:DMT family transporter n=1 Tax=Palleronia sp. THAF1 TaxID=2587842 RepID=UPI000F532CFF|nr:DMT family transporter [Palleronia sp. THAF1]
MSPRLIGPLLALLSFGLYATHDAVVKLLGGSYSPIQIVFFSVLFAFPLATLLLMQEKSAATLRPVNPGWVALRTVAAVATGVSGFYAFTVLPLAEAYALIFASPLLITVLSIPILGESVGRHRWAAVLVGLFGVMVVLRPGATALTLGHAAALMAALGHATASVISRKIGNQERGVVMVLYPMMVNVVLMGCLLPSVYVPMPLVDLGLTAVIAGLGFTAGLIIITAFRQSDAAVVAPMHYSQILWAALYGWLFFDETGDTATWIGAGIIIASGLYVVLREAGGASENSPVLKARTRLETGTSPRIAAAIRARAAQMPPGYQALANRDKRQ